jgi:hypothetical protein
VTVRNALLGGRAGGVATALGVAAGQAADSDDFGRAFRSDVGHRFRLMSAGHSD